MAALSTLRTEKPRDFYRRIADLGIQAAEALDHAHQMGIVHRDIKPSNLILEVRSAECGMRSDQNSELRAPHSKLWITDFGLARIASAEAPGLTMTGDLLGTLRYMSPEQAEGRSAVLDHRTDIYSLGITLYELLALQPAFNGSDREEVLRQIAFEEPTALRRLKPSIPVELETIIHKSISKNPDDRYPTARDLADDLRRFAHEQPIKARPLSAMQRLLRWTRRHHGIVVAVAVVCLLLITASVISTALIAAAYRQETEQRELANRNATNAKENLDIALTAVDRILNHIDEPDLYRHAAAQPVLRKLMHESKQLASQMHAKAGGAVNPRLGDLYVKIGVVLRSWGEYEEAEKSCQEAAAIWRNLSLEHPDADLFRMHLAVTQSSLSQTRAILGRPDAVQLAEEAISIWRTLRFDKLDMSRDQWLRYQIRVKGDWAFTVGKLNGSSASRRAYEDLYAELNRAGSDETAEERAVRTSALANACFNLGLFEALENNLDDAERLLRRSVELGFKGQLDLQNVLRARGKVDEARTIVLESQQRFQRQLAENPTNVIVAMTLASSYWDLGKIERAAQRTGHALDALRTSWKRWRELGALEILDLDRCWWAADAAEELAELLEQDGRIEEALALYGEHADLWREQWKKSPRNKYQLLLAGVETKRGILLLRLGRSDEARAVFMQVEHLLRATAPESPELALFLANCPDPELRKPVEALNIAKKLLGSIPRSAEYLCALGVAQYRTGNFAGAIETLTSARQSAARVDPAHYFLVLAEFKLGNREQAREQWRRLSQSYSPALGSVRDHKSIELILEEIRQEVGLSTDDELVIPPSPSAPNRPSGQQPAEGAHGSKPAE
ncbi:MAG: protein kinase [Pirellulales bacterium]